MQAVQFHRPGGTEELFLGEYPTPVPGPREILVKVAYTALNRADLLQRTGNYPVPPDDSPIMGLEMSGKVVAIGSKVNKWSIGDEVFGLLNGGGYAEQAVIHEDMAMPIPDGLSLREAAAIPEVFLTAFQALHWIGQLQAGETALIHAGASGVGTAALQLVRLAGATSIVTASAGKHAICRELGAARAIDYRTEDFAEVVKEITDGKGVNVIVDFIAANYFKQNLNALGLDGRMIMLALMGGIKVPEVNLALILGKRLQITGSTLRSRSLDYKIRLTGDFYRHAHEHFSSGRLRPIIDSVFSWEEVKAAHDYMEANKNQGKILLRVHGED
ncbi:NAD(P)H-quinone oxidoreductase [Flavilitoribacter nigricans]|uniref:NADPH:quinone oxidoreductase n=1 Tax=Flavilitoribacter nigricans (strain ATCC 23147 / DSM 23189 / NBRC 102662 / NCIMB 1420 / SS-2) TaxID=1122177 RepID=A0A2D0MX66_FLAN2|nr:NADPH:quinone oxidoreductase [Flavilitoribacter nigricans DSM 23189 = NBRC 102662]